MVISSVCKVVLLIFVDKTWDVYRKRDYFHYSTNVMGLLRWAVEQHEPQTWSQHSHINNFVKHLHLFAAGYKGKLFSSEWWAYSYFEISCIQCIWNVFRLCYLEVCKAVSSVKKLLVHMCELSAIKITNIGIAALIVCDTTSLSSTPTSLDTLPTFTSIAHYNKSSKHNHKLLEMDIKINLYFNHVFKTLFLWHIRHLGVTKCYIITVNQTNSLITHLQFIIPRQNMHKVTFCPNDNFIMIKTKKPFTYMIISWPKIIQYHLKSYIKI